MPMTSVVGLIVGDYDQMENTYPDGVVASGTEVLLASGVRLHRRHGYPQIAHTTRPMMTTIVPAIHAKSRVFLRAGRKGLKPMLSHVTDQPQSYRAGHVVAIRRPRTDSLAHPRSGREKERRSPPGLERFTRRLF